MGKQLYQLEYNAYVQFYLSLDLKLHSYLKLLGRGPFPPTPFSEAFYIFVIQLDYFVIFWILSQDLHIFYIIFSLHTLRFI